MSHYFLDSSALLKRHVVEPGSRWVRAFTSPAVGHELFVAAIVRVEAVSALGVRNLRLLIERQIGRCIVAEANDAVLQRACDLLERHALRAYDAVQLASALESNDRLQARALAPITFFSADQRLLVAASAEGPAVEDPNLHA